MKKINGSLFVLVFHVKNKDGSLNKRGLQPWTKLKE